MEESVSPSPSLGEHQNRQSLRGAGQAPARPARPVQPAEAARQRPGADPLGPEQEVSSRPTKIPKAGEIAIRVLSASDGDGRADHRPVQELPNLLPVVHPVSRQKNSRGIRL